MLSLTMPGEAMSNHWKYQLHWAYVNWSASVAALVPPDVVTVTSTTPAAWAGLTAAICVSDTNVKPAAGVAPKLTAVTPVKPMPLIVTFVPPRVGPELTMTAVTFGGPP